MMIIVCVNKQKCAQIAKTNDNQREGYTTNFSGIMRKNISRVLSKKLIKIGNQTQSEFNGVWSLK